MHGSPLSAWRLAARLAALQPGLLAHDLGLDTQAVMDALGCDEPTAIRLLLCDTPRRMLWRRDVAMLADRYGVPRDQLMAFLEPLHNG